MAEGLGPFGSALPYPPPAGPALAVPVKAVGAVVIDREDRIIATCPNFEIAEKLAFVVNAHAGTLP